VGINEVELAVEKIRELLPKGLAQPANSRTNRSLQNVAQFGVSQPKVCDDGEYCADDNCKEEPPLRGGDAAHTGQQMYSCGSLAPKLKRGGGCMDHGFAREQEPWEASDGAICLMRELAALDPQAICDLLPIVAALAAKADFTHCERLHERIWRELPLIGAGVVQGTARGVGKRLFKRSLDAFLEPLFRSLGAGTPLAQSAAGSCAVGLSQLVGGAIFVGRLSPEMTAILLQSEAIPDQLKIACGGVGGVIQPVGIPKQRSGSLLRPVQ